MSSLLYTSHIAVKNTLISTLSLGAGIFFSWFIFGSTEANGKVRNREHTSPGPQSTSVTETPDNLRPSEGPTGDYTRSAEAAEMVQIPPGLLGFLKADAVNILSLEFKPAALTALGLSQKEGAALKAAIRTVSLKASEFQKGHAILKQDASGGSYYLISQDPAASSALFAELKNITTSALPNVDPAIANAAFHLLESSPLLGDFQYPLLELSIIDSTAFGPNGEAKPSLEIKRFDSTGRSAGRQVIMASEELLATRFPFLMGISGVSK